MIPLRRGRGGDRDFWKGCGMATEPDLYYLYQPTQPRSAGLRVAFQPASEFLQDEPACKLLWDLISTQFRTRSKFLAVWSGVRFVACHRNPDGIADGFLLVNTPINWQIDYVVVHPDARGQGIGAAIVVEALNQAFLHRAPYVMLTSKPGLRSFYESCGFAVVGSAEECLQSAASF
jgi:GNAT superfamily N-acetyltransferase